MFFQKRSKGLIEAEKALAEADEHLEQVRARSKEARDLSQSLRTIRERNHFAEQLETLLGPRRELGGGTTK